jgi:hypothetical protein
VIVPPYCGLSDAVGVVVVTLVVNVVVVGETVVVVGAGLLLHATRTSREVPRQAEAKLAAFLFIDSSS